MILNKIVRQMLVCTSMTGTLMATQVCAKPEHSEGIVTTTAVPQTLNDVLQAAIQRHPDYALMANFAAASEIQQDAANQWLSEPVSVAGRYNSDAMADDIGQEEWEVIANFSVIPMGERSARQQYASAEADVAFWTAKAVELRTAGDVRSLVWGFQLAEQTYQSLESALVTATQLEQAVAVMVKVGERSNSDLALISVERLKTEMALEDARAELEYAQHRYELMTGYEHMPVQQTETAIPEPDGYLEEHPEVLLAQAQRRAAEENTNVANDTWQSKPQFGLGYREEKPVAGAEAIGSVGLFVTVPLDFGTGNRSAKADALRAQGIAQSAYAVKYRELQITLHDSEITLRSAERGAKLAQARFEVAEKAQVAVKIAFEHNEASVMELIAAQNNFLDAKLGLAAANIEQHRAIAALNQAAGVLP